MIAKPAAPAPHADRAAEPDLLGRAQALVPRIAAAAESIDRERRIPEPLLTELLDAGLFRMLLPRSLGGWETDPVTFIRVIETVAGAEASTAWNLCQNAVCAMTAAYMAPAVARKVFGDPRAILAWGPPAGSDACGTAVEGGYRVSGTWSFASGMRHATWLACLCPIREPDGKPRSGDGGKPVWRTMVFRPEQARISDVWHVLGLRGTASDSFTLDGVFVPAAFAVARDDARELREPGRLYSFATIQLFPLGFGCVGLGIARSMLDAFERLARDKTPRGMPSPLRDNAETQSDVGQAEGKLRSARAFLYDTASGIWAAAQPGVPLTMEQRVEIRLAASHAILSARQVADLAYEAAGATAIFGTNPFEKRFRDMHTVAQQVQGRKAHFQSVGKFLLGLEPDTAFL
jgi:alkylation response protein AidB-like acyl-CoA dehydrogenase